MRRAISAFWKELRWGDWVVLGALLLLVVLTSLPRPARPSEGGRATVHLPDGSAIVLSLEEPGDYSYAGSRGLSVLRVEAESIRFIDSACPNKLCVQWGSIHRQGEIRVCLPNQVWVTIEAGEKDGAVDAVSH